MIEDEVMFDSRRYWEERLQAHPDITGVGYLGYPPRFVRQYYRSRMCRVEAALRRHRLTNLAGRSVLDIGSGTGIWLNFWHRHGADRVVGLDFATPSVELLQVQFPGDLIVQADVSAGQLPLPDTMRFDVISAFEVLLHITDADALRRTMANLAARCVPGGWLIISDPIVQGHGYLPPRARAGYSTVHLVDEYRDALAEHGFRIESIHPATVLFCSPLEAPNHLTFQALSFFWKLTRHWGYSEMGSRLAGPVAVQLDQLACRLFSGGNSPASKIIFARKIG